MQIFPCLRIGDNRNTFTTDCQKSDTISTVKNYVSIKSGIPADQMYFIFKDNRLDDNMTIEDYNICQYDTIYICLKLRGGMHHVTSSIEVAQQKITK
jgi:hypothetical protein